jgi:hypothetical protein
MMLLRGKIEMMQMDLVMRDRRGLRNEDQGTDKDDGTMRGGCLNTVCVVVGCLNTVYGGGDNCARLGGLVWWLVEEVLCKVKRDNGVSGEDSRSQWEQH